MTSVPVVRFSDPGLISDVLRTIEHTAGIASGLGSGCQAALQLCARRSGVGLGRRIFVFTDAIVTSPAEIGAFRSAMADCEATGIDVLGIGLGISPLHLPELFGVCLYAPSPADLDLAAAAAMGVSGKASSSEILSRQLYHQPEKDAIPHIRDRLCNAGPRFCTDLAASIRDHGISKDFLILFGKPELLIMNNQGYTRNPEEDPYDDGAFNGFKILVVILYFEKSGITLANFHLNCGTVLKSKGFDYTVACSYGDAIAQLTRNENGRCPYTELWLIPSSSATSLPPEAVDKDTRKMHPFFNAVRDFWMMGGGLFLFPDNSPYTFQVNQLLANYLTFSHNGKTGRTNVRFEGGYYGDKFITVNSNEAPLCGCFTPKCSLPPPGRCPLRLTLRPGLVTFYEGITISSAVNPSQQPISTEADLWPFTPFAWTSETGGVPRPFVLFHDPKITSNTMECSGPVVIHGGFTSAFIKFGDSNSKYGGTGRLIISIACWLTRFEERHLLTTATGQMINTVSLLTGNYSV
jgi:hypothetical protein